jgi:ABC-2 type transport system permease protein
MEASLDLSRWREMPNGVGYRRWTIVSTGLRQIFSTRLFRILIGVAWIAGLALAGLGFLFAQTVATGGWLESLASYVGPRAEAFSSALAAFILMYPDLCIGGWFTLIFWLHSYLGLWISLLALTAVVPRLITRDRSTNALTVYLSRPLTSGDYLLGKLGIIVGVLVILWAGPLLFGWLLSVAFAPNSDFIVYSFSPLWHALLFHLIALVTLAAIALGVSALTKTSRATIVLWIGLWLILGGMAQPPGTPQWLRRMSFTQNLDEARRGIIKLDTAFSTISEGLPMLDRNFARNLTEASGKIRTGDFKGSLAALGAFVALSSFVFLRRIRPE